MINIITDSCCDLTPEQISKHKLPVIPLYVFEKDTNYLDGVDITTPKLFDLVKQTGELPKTSAPSVTDYMKYFEKEGDILYIGISSKLSVSFQNALLAKDGITKKKVILIDSKSLSTGIGLLVLKAVELRDQGLPIEKIAEEIENLIPRLNVSFVIDTLDYLYMGGRCSSMEHVIGSMLKIRPVIDVRPDGTLGVKTKVGGSRKKALNSLIEDFKSKLPNVDLHRVFITHTYCDADAEYLKSELEKIVKIDEICISYAGSTIASHCGPNTIGILFFGK